MGIEPTYSAWKADILPLNYIRMQTNNLKSEVNQQMKYRHVPLCMYST